MWEGPPCSQDEGTVRDKRRRPQGDFNTPVGSWAPPTPPPGTRPGCIDPSFQGAWSLERARCGPAVAKKQRISGSGTALSAVRPPGLGAPQQRSEDPRSCSSPLHPSCSPTPSCSLLSRPFSEYFPPTPHQTGPELRAAGSAAGLRLQTPGVPRPELGPSSICFLFGPGDAGGAGKVRLAAREQQEAARRGLSAVRLAVAVAAVGGGAMAPLLFPLSPECRKQTREEAQALWHLF